MNLPLPTIAIQKQSSKNPFNADFCHFVIERYLFRGDSMTGIEQAYFPDRPDKSLRGFDAKAVLDYYGINSQEHNKGLYSGIDQAVVIKKLLAQPDPALRRIGYVLDYHESEAKQEISNYGQLTRFRQYFNAHGTDLKDVNQEHIASRQQFIQEYPLGRLSELSLDDYALGDGKERSRNSLCYRLEYGDYGDTGMGIGGSSAAKFGIYRRNGKYYGGNNVEVQNPEQLWLQLRTAITGFIHLYGDSDKPMRASQYSPLLRGMSMPLTKLLFLYYPDKFITICSKAVLMKLLKYLGYDFDDHMEAEELSFLLNQRLRNDLPDIFQQNDPQVVGRTLWNFASDLSEAKTEVTEKRNLELYTDRDFLNEVFVSENEYRTLKNLLERKQNIILEGAPGVGKTFLAKRLAYAILGQKDPSKILTVQFHQNYSYEDFVEGIRPTVEGQLEIRDGIFKEFCQHAAQDPDSKYFCIIDEINRSNLSKVFGELMMLVEHDKREESVVLPYSRAHFSIPQNIYMIGTMNTADRSLALVDYALRRRFAFYPVQPAFKSDKLKDYLSQQKHLPKDFIDNLIPKLIKLNEEISNRLGQGFMIGHSYFVDQLSSNHHQEDYKEILQYEIRPLLEEYFYDDADEVVNLMKSLE